MFKKCSRSVCSVLLVHHDVAGAGHVVLVETLDVEADVVAGVGDLDALVVP